MRAIGYHGTSDAAAQRILASGFEVSRNEYDWLGDGAYFFQDASARAWEWARQRFGDNAAVVGAEIDLEDCVDFLDITWERVIAQAYALFRHQMAHTGAPMPRQTPGAHRLDRHVLNYLAVRMEADGLLVRSVRGAFPEGEPIFPGSALLNRSHVQIAVRDPLAITCVWREGKEGWNA